MIAKGLSSSLRSTIVRCVNPLSHSPVSSRCLSSAAVAEHPEGLEIFDYAELAADPSADTITRLERAFGYSGLGILAVRNVPGYLEKRETLLPMAYKLANLPKEELVAMEHPRSFWSFGWSCGKEQFEGQPDFSKGSFYANPLVDAPTDDEELIEKYPSFYCANIWPTKQLPELESAFKDLGRLVVQTGVLVGKHADALVRESIPSYPDNMLSEILRTSTMCKGRLLHYYPMSEPSSTATTEQSSWCGWHNDHGSLTGLANAMFHDAEGNPIPCPDEKAGLYIKSRQGAVVRVTMPGDCMAFQIGETAMIHSGGVLQATPHSVQAAEAEGVSRSTLAIFMEPEVHHHMSVPEGADSNRVLKSTTGEFLPPGVPALATRWNNDMDFAEFTDKTLSSYH